MALTYSKHFNTTQTPQSEKIPGSKQVKNSAGGYSFAVDKWTQLNRFLILGTEGGSYYASEKNLTIKNCDSSLECLKENGVRVVDTAVDISKTGRAPKNDPALFVLAMALKLGDEETRRHAAQKLPEVARIGTHLFHFVEYVKAFGGFGRNTKRAISDWYLQKAPENLAFQMVKYQQRDGWSHSDLLRLAHVKTNNDIVNSLFRWAGTKYDENFNEDFVGLPVVEGFERAKKAQTAKEVISLIDQYNLTREMIPTEFLSDKKVLESLLPKMGLTAVLRNLANLTRAGVLEPLSDNTSFVVDRITNEESLRKSRVHPVAILAALITYASGNSARGSNTWTPVTQIVDALDDAFYASFGNVEPTGKKLVLGVDVSGSMGHVQSIRNPLSYGWGYFSGTGIAGVPGLTPMIGAAAMALITNRVEKNSVITAFSHELVEVNISARERLDDVLQKLQKITMGGTDCAKPMLYAINKNISADGFVVYTDSETWCGDIHPIQALQQHRKKFGINSKLVVVGMVSNGFSIADPNDAGMLDVVGFDTATPQLISDFVSDKF